MHYLPLNVWVKMAHGLLLYTRSRNEAKTNISSTVINFIDFPHKKHLWRKGRLKAWKKRTSRCSHRRNKVNGPRYEFVYFSFSSLVYPRERENMQYILNTESRASCNKKCPATTGGSLLRVSPRNLRAPSTRHTSMGGNTLNINSTM